MSYSDSVFKMWMWTGEECNNLLEKVSELLWIYLPASHDSAESVFITSLCSMLYRKMRWLIKILYSSKEDNINNLVNLFIERS